MRDTWIISCSSLSLYDQNCRDQLQSPNCVNFTKLPILRQKQSLYTKIINTKGCTSSKWEIWNTICLSNDGRDSQWQPHAGKRRKHSEIRIIHWQFEASMLLWASAGLRQCFRSYSLLPTNRTALQEMHFVVHPQPLSLCRMQWWV